MALGVITVLSGVMGSQSAMAATPEAACVQAARQVADESGVPFQVLLALSLTETGRAQDGDLAPWPWTVNEAGEGYWFNTKAEALQFLEGRGHSVMANVDIGCFQLNLRWHGAAFSSFEEMIDPLRNARYAAQYLRTLYQNDGDWRRAAGAYHSSTPEYAKIYLARYDEIYANLDTGTGPAVVARNAYPLLQAGTVSGLGSLVPLQTGARPLIGG